MMRATLSRAWKSLKPLWRSERGNVLILTSLGLPIMIGGAGLGVDTAQWYLWRRELQAAVDVAALSGAYTYSQNGAFDYNASAQAELARNVDVVAVDAEPATLGNWRGGTNNAITVTASTQRTLPFSQMFGVAAPRINAAATAAIIPDGRHCMISLDRNAASAINVYGSALINLGCGISSNSRHASAITFDGNSSVRASPISAVGGITAEDENLEGDTTIRPYAPAQKDPFASLTPPANPPAGTITSNSMTSGTYTGGVTINSNRNVTMQPGLYVIDGGTFRVNGNASLIGDGVTIVLKNGATLDLNGGSTIDLKAPTSAGNNVPSNLVGMVVYDADPPNAAISQSRINGNNTLRLSGAVYMPRQNVEISGNADPRTNCLLMVGNTISVGGNASIVDTCTGPRPYGADTDVDVVRLVQ